MPPEIGDHGRGREDRGRRRHPVELGLEFLILRFEREGGGLPAAQPLVLSAQPRIFRPDVPDLDDIGAEAPHLGQWRCHGRIDGGEHVGEGHAHFDREHGIRLADQHEAEGRRDQHRKREFFQCLADGYGEPNHRVRISDLSLSEDGAYTRGREEN